MNILIGITILLVLMLSDSMSGAFCTELGGSPHALSLVGAFLLTLVSPFLAAIQVFAYRLTDSKTQSYEEQLVYARHSALLHTMVWFAASLATIFLAKWHEVVRVAWQLHESVLLDELIILSPILISLISSWAIFFDQYEWMDSSKSRLRGRYEYVSLRCKVYLLVVLVPILIMVLIKDTWPYLNQISPIVAGTVAVIAVSAMLCCMPLIVRLMWTNRTIRESEGRTELLELCDRHRMAVRDIRVWETGNRVMNALVAGIFPRLRVLMVSDLLIKTFPTNELKAILRHEAGHVRLNHLPIRVGFVFLPALAMVALETSPNNVLHNFLMTLNQDGLMPLNPSLVLGLIFISYILLITAWLSKNMEFEADLYAIGAIGRPDNRVAFEDSIPNNAQSMADALLRFGAEYPEQLDKRSITHPSLNDRIAMILAAESQPELIKRFRFRFSACQIAIALAIPVATALLLVV